MNPVVGCLVLGSLLYLELDARSSFNVYYKVLLSLMCFFRSPASTTDERCRPPLTDLQIDDVASSIHPGKDLDRIVKEKIQFLKLLCPSLVSSSSKGSISKKRVVQTEEEVESYVRKLKIKVPLSIR